MTEVTRVPILPIKKGSVPKLWLGVAALALAGAGLAWASVPQGLEIAELTAGTGASPVDGQVAIVSYTGSLQDGTVFDKGEQVPMPVGSTIQGFDQALRQMKPGGKYDITIPAHLAYGAHPPMGSAIPANADLDFEVELHEVLSREDFDQRMKAMQQMMQQMQQQGALTGQ